MTSSYVNNTIFYPGHVSIKSLHYKRFSQTIVCVSTGGPATSVIWLKDDVLVNFENYVTSQVIVDLTNVTYENRLEIVNKSSNSAGNYSCQVSNSRGSSTESFLYIQGK